ncbi:MAG: A/G-specific adenine glycosylase [Deltaproteobacteria bacterium]|nr:A/G-specific adenine glycosylase [Deltaproteobacteria bacterium]
MSTTVRQILLSWYDTAARDLPWRRTRDPYAIWVSEIMCQQTRVDTVIPYYGRFLERFPTPSALAKAGEDEVMSLWSGLGYYRRARLLHAGVKEVVASYGGQVPRDAAARRALPGVGRYTCGAIGSVAFGLPEAIVDGNVARVLSRLHAIDAPLGTAASDKQLWALAGGLAAGPRPGDLNQALMELGALVCTPKSPSCDACPVRGECGAREADRVDELPVPKKKKKPREVTMVAVVPRRRDTTWLVKGGGSLFGGLFGVPSGEGAGVAAARLVLAQHGLTGRVVDEDPPRVRHVLSHRRLEVSVYRATHANGEASSALRAFTDEQLTEVGIATLTRKILKASV